MLEMALTNWAMSYIAKLHSYTPITTPDFAHINLVEACGFWPRDEASQVYLLDNNRDCLVGTSEIPLAGMYAGELVDRTKLPHKMIAHSHCFRKEAGSGFHSKGLYRLHQFSKVEMFAISEGNAKESNGILEEMLGI
jgi:seryl-tRNA synthetase